VFSSIQTYRVSLQTGSVDNFTKRYAVQGCIGYCISLVEDQNLGDRYGIGNVKEMYAQKYVILNPKIIPKL
jgi:hypothetical protein